MYSTVVFMGFVALPKISIFLWYFASIWNVTSLKQAKTERNKQIKKKQDTKILQETNIWILKGAFEI